MNSQPFSQKAIEARLKRAEQRLSSLCKAQECWLMSSGTPMQKPGGLDQTYGFLPHPTYFWLTGSRRPGQTLLYSKSTGWVHFTAPVTQEERVWEGVTEVATLTTNNQSIENLQSFLKNEGLSPVSGPREFEFRNQVDQVRRIKDSEEIALIEQVAQMALAGYKKMPAFIRPGVSEREIQIEYETAVFKAGCDFMPYETIVGTGSNSGILHAIPSSRRVQDQDMVLMDAGAALFDYCVDITRIFPSSGKLTTQQQELYNVVLKAHEKSFELCKSGITWPQVHEASARVIADGLIQWGLCSGSVDSLLDSEAISVFFPHGVGHLVGLRVRDSGCEENQRPKKYFGARLRVDLTLEENMILTVEPGCYFIPTLLNQPETRTRFKGIIHFDKIEAWLKVGGVRIEDDILIGKDRSKNLTAVVPKL